MKSCLKRLMIYGGAVVLCLVALTSVLRLTKADLRVPFQWYGDTIMYMALVKGVQDHGWYLHNDYVGAPGTMDMHDFPLVDSLFFFMFKGLLFVTRGEVALSYNLFFLLTFPLTTVTSLFVLRRMGVSTGPAVLVSLLYAFLPYHFLRGEGHLFLASYFLVPLAILLMLRIYLRQSINWTGATVICLLLGCGGIYYAFFSCFLFVVVGASAAIQNHKFRPLWESGALVALTCVVVGANLVPTFLYQMEHGPNKGAIVRDPEQAELLSLKATHLVMPVNQHRSRFLERTKNEYNKYFAKKFTFSDYVTLGLAGTIGFVFLLGWLLIRRYVTRPQLTDALATMNAACLILACSGGAGTLFSLYVSPMIRGYNRICVFIAFFSLFALAHVLHLLYQKLESRWTRVLFQAALAVALVLGIRDQCPKSFVPPYDILKDIFTSEAEFVRKIEDSVPAHSMIFQMPATTYPEGPCNPYWSATDHLRCYVHSRTLRWSYGSIRGREADNWRASVESAPLPEMLHKVVDAGFKGIVLDRAFYKEREDPQPELMRLLGEGPKFSCPRYHYYDLTAYRTRLNNGGTSGALDGEIKLPSIPHWSRNMVWEGNKGVGQGNDPMAGYNLPASLKVEHVELESVIHNQTKKPVHLQFFWTDASECFSEKQSYAVSIPPSAGDQPVRVRIPVGMEIGRLRIDPDTQPCTFEIRSLKLISPPSSEDDKVTR